MQRASRPHSRSSSGHDSVRLFTHGCATTRRCCSRPIGPSQQPQAKGARSPRPLNGYSITTTSSKSKSARSARIFRSEEHTSELQSHVNLVCRLLLEKKKIDQ